MKKDEGKKKGESETDRQAGRQTETGERLSS